ncbi:periplasmic binding protein-like II [Neocallimastix lanati (nom. inval.)]|nr:periplasmic binding protein-like II [Neocallimastix sp. JGI-2020a]
MIKSRIFLLIVLNFIFNNLINNVIALNLNALAYAPLSQTQIYSMIVNDFNEYSKINNLNVTLDLTLILPSNSTSNTDDYCSVIDVFLEKKSDKYDIIFYNNVYTSRFEPLFLDLNEWLPKDFINMFENIERSESYSYNNKLIGIPVYIIYSVIYNNMKYLNKYNKKIPKTWNELLETGKYILKQENKLNNTNILIYNGGFVEDEIGMGTIYEFMYSYRDNVEAPFPSLRSKNALEALKMIKKLKNEISADKYYLDLDYPLEKLIDGNGVFIKSNYINIPIDKNYKVSILPGNKPGVSGTLIGGYNIGLNKYSSNDKKNASVKALMYMTSKDVQRKLMKNYKRFSGISSLYDEKEICEINDLCYIHNNVQPVARPTSITNDYNEYSEKFRYYIYKYLYGKDDVDPAEMLRHIDDITRYYYISINSKDSNIGILIVIIYGILSLTIILSSIFLFIKKFSLCFTFLTKEFWILSLTGYVLLIFTSFIDLERVTTFRCHLKLFLVFICFTFIFIPVLHKLISNYPEDNKISYWIKRHPYLFVILFVIFDLFINGLILIHPYKVENVIITNDKNFQKCSTNGLLSRIIIIISIVLKIIIFLFSSFLIFIEWYLKFIFSEIHWYASAYLIDLLYFILIIIFTSVDIRNYYAYFLIRELISIMIVMTNYILLYVIRIIRFKTNNNCWNDYYMEKFPQSGIDTTPTYLRKFSRNFEISSLNDNNIVDSNNNNNKKKNNKIFKYLEDHFRSEIKSSRKRGCKSEQIVMRKNILYSPIDHRRRASFSKNYCSEKYVSSNHKSSLILSANYENNKNSENILFNKKNSISNNSLINKSKNNEDISQLTNTILNSNNNNNISSSSTKFLLDEYNQTSISSNSLALSKEELDNLMENQKDITENK